MIELHTPIEFHTPIEGTARFSQEPKEVTLVLKHESGLSAEVFIPVGVIAESEEHKDDFENFMDNLSDLFANVLDAAAAEESKEESA